MFPREDWGASNSLRSLLKCDLDNRRSRCSAGDHPFESKGWNHPRKQGPGRVARARHGMGASVRCRRRTAARPGPQHIRSANCTAIRSAGRTSSARVGGTGTILTSSNGVAWNQQISGTHADLEDVVFGNGQWVAVGSDGAILLSADGARWNLRASDTDRGLYAAAYGNGEWIATGESGVILSSPDGVLWTNRNSGVN